MTSVVDTYKMIQYDSAGNALGRDVGGRMSVATAFFTRPANTTAYDALDAVANSASAPTILTFSDVARAAGGSGYVVAMRLMTDQAANVAQFRLHLFHTAPTAINDNAAYTLLWANRANRVGYIDANCQTEGSGSTAANGLNAVVRLPFVCAAGSSALYGLLETRTVFTPASAQNFYIELFSELN